MNKGLYLELERYERQQNEMEKAERFGVTD